MRSTITSIVVFVALVLLSVFAISNSVVFAQNQLPEFSGPIVPCGVGENSDRGPFACQACELIQLAQNIINFFIFLATIIAILMFVYAGFLYIFAGGDTGKVKKAHGIFWNVLWGFVIVLAAWLIIDFIMKSFLVDERLGEQNLGPWNEVLCRAAGTKTSPDNTGGIEAPF